MAEHIEFTVNVSLAGNSQICVLVNRIQVDSPAEAVDVAVDVLNKLASAPASQRLAKVVGAHSITTVGAEIDG